MMELKDIVHGRSPHWHDRDIRKATLRVRRRGTAKGAILIEIRGEFAMRDDRHRFEATLYGEAAFDPAAGRFTRFEAFAAGPRTGSTAGNFRHQDPGPAPLGISLVMVPPPPELPAAACLSASSRVERSNHTPDADH